MHSCSIHKSLYRVNKIEPKRGKRVIHGLQLVVGSYTVYNKPLGHISSNINGIAFAPPQIWEICWNSINTLLKLKHGCRSCPLTNEKLKSVSSKSLPKKITKLVGSVQMRHPEKFGLAAQYVL
jgi:hypothetical protein